MSYVPTLLEIRTDEDGETTYFDLINGDNGLLLEEGGWEPAVIQEKDGGVFVNSPMADGQALVFERWDNAIEDLSLKARAQSGNGISVETSALKQLFQKAKAYSKSAWQNEPVYLALKPGNQDNEQYALIVIGRIPNISTPDRDWETVT